MEAPRRVQESLRQVPAVAICFPTRPSIRDVRTLNSGTEGNSSRFFVSTGMNAPHGLKATIVELSLQLQTAAIHQPNSIKTQEKRGGDSMGSCPKVLLMSVSGVEGAEAAAVPALVAARGSSCRSSRNRVNPAQYQFPDAVGVGSDQGRSTSSSQEAVADGSRQSYPRTPHS